MTTSEETYREKVSVVKDVLSRGGCTLEATFNRHTYQYHFTCLSCNMKGICVACASKCHIPGDYSPCFCACSSVRGKCYLYPKQNQSPEIPKIPSKVLDCYFKSPGTCTFESTKQNGQQQYVFLCQTCKSPAIVCLPCVFKCHMGHKMNNSAYNVAFCEDPCENNCLLSDKCEETGIALYKLIRNFELFAKPETKLYPNVIKVKDLSELPIQAINGYLMDPNYQKHVEMIDKCYLIRAACYVSINNFTNAIVDYSKVINNCLSMTEKYCMVFNNRACAYFRFGDTANALKDIKQAFKLLKSQDGDIEDVLLYNRARINLHLKKVGAAQKGFEKCVQKNPENVDALLNLGKIYTDKKKHQKVANVYSKLIMWDDKNPYFYNHRGVAYMKMENFIDAERDFSKTMQFGESVMKIKNDPAILINRAFVYEKLNNYLKAVENYDCAVALEENNISYYQKRMACCEKLRNFAKAKEDCQVLSRLDTKNFKKWKKKFKKLENLEKSSSGTKKASIFSAITEISRGSRRINDDVLSDDDMFVEKSKSSTQDVQNQSQPDPRTQTQQNDSNVPMVEEGQFNVPEFSASMYQESQEKEKSKFENVEISVLDPELFSSFEVIATGANGKVFKCSMTRGKKKYTVAVKCIELSVSPESVVEEIKRFCYLHHPNLIKVYGYYFENNSVNICMEFMGMGNLKHFVENEKKIKFSKKLQMAREMINGVSYLLKNNVACAVDPYNFLISKSKEIKISTNFGLSSVAKGRSTTAVDVYVAPEIDRSQIPIVYTPESAVFGLGMTIYLLLFEKEPTCNVTKGEIPEIPDGVVEDIKELLTGMWVIVEKRISIEKCTEYIKKIEQENQN